MQIERQKHLGAAPHERTEERNGHANGYQDKTLSTRLGQITVAVPQVREVNGQGAGFYPESLERSTRSERALKLALAEMYVQGVSTRKVAAITEQLCGFAVSSTQVSQAAQALDETLAAWRSRPLCACPYVYLDARYERVRQSGLVQKAAVLIAVGVDEAEKRSVLGVSLALSEHEVHWREFLQSLGVGLTVDYKEATVVLAQSDVLLLVTDGVTEARNEQGEFLDSNGTWLLLRNALLTASSQKISASENVLALLDVALTNYISSNRCDDVAMLLLRRN